MEGCLKRETTMKRNLNTAHFLVYRRSTEYDLGQRETRALRVILERERLGLKVYEAKLLH